MATAKEKLVASQSDLKSFFQVPTSDQIKKKLRVSITNCCNFNCFFCHNEGSLKDNKHLPINSIFEIVEESLAIGINQIKLTGGEPLIYEDRSNNIIDVITKINLLKNSNNFELSLTTNGSRLQSFASNLKRAGLDRITVSLHTIDQFNFVELVSPKNKTTVNQILKGLVEATKYFDDVKINTVLYESENYSNIEELPKIADFALENNISELRLFTLLNTKKLTSFDEFYVDWLDKKVINQIRKIASRTNFDESIHLLKNYSSVNLPVRLLIPLERGKHKLKLSIHPFINNRFNDSSDPCSLCKEKRMCQEGFYTLRVNANGDLRSCLLKKTNYNIYSLNVREALTKALSEMPSSISCLRNSLNQPVITER